MKEGRQNRLGLLQKIKIFNILAIKWFDLNPINPLHFFFYLSSLLLKLNWLYPTQQEPNSVAVQSARSARLALYISFHSVRTLNLIWIKTHTHTHLRWMKEWVFCFLLQLLCTLLLFKVIKSDLLSVIHDGITFGVPHWALPCWVISNQIDFLSLSLSYLSVCVCAEKRWIFPC